MNCQQRAPWKRIAKMVGTLLVVGILLTLFAIWSYDPFSARLAELRAAGEKISLEDFAEVPVPKEQNADTYLTAASPGVNRLIDTFLKGHETGDSILLKTLVDYNAADLDAIKRAFDSEPDVVTLLEEATAAPAAYHQITWDVRTQKLSISDRLLFQQYRSASNVISVQARYLARTGNGDEAIQWCIRQLKLSRHARQPTTGTAWLIGHAIRGAMFEVASEVIRHANVSPDALDQFQTELATEDDQALYRRVHDVERAWLIGYFSHEIEQHPLQRPWLRLRARGHLDRLSTEIARLDLPYLAYTQTTPPDRQWLGLINGEDWQKSFPLMRVAAEDCRARKRCLQVLIAIKKVSPELREDLSVAALDLPGDASTDPYAAELLRFKPTNRGPIIYSIGKNLVDDGGAIHGEDGLLDIGFGPVVTRFGRYLREVKAAMKVLSENFREGAKIKYWSRLLPPPPSDPLPRED